ncbi:hypothetical protein ZIOFF_075106 [Zingiber officinale]|uniref:RNA-dependent RNA polymerase n=1 Tax=Zingiber officinale TaxID=94328 RepID=A0A8J5C4T5_ZINOF|nr:hypothetical protein ZIOFF_075106 [Zingiber officinale]
MGFTHRSAITASARMDVPFTGSARPFPDKSATTIQEITATTYTDSDSWGVPLNKGFSWVPTWKSTPNDDREFSGPKAVPSIFTAMKYEVASFARDLRLIHSKEGVFSPGILWVKRVLWPLDNSWNTRMVNKDLRFYETQVGPIFDELATAFEGYPLRPGRLACSLEGAGKRRLFAIGNYIRQRLLHPVHDWGMRVLSRLPCDGTFQQERPIHRLALLRPSEVDSFDLSSATDRWPVSVIHDLMACIFGPSLASCIVNGSLALSAFWVGPPLVGSSRFLCFRTGQPLGYYGSWALLSLSHHYLVWLAALIVGWGHTPFTRYALLGDDIVIADRAVAEQYRKLLGLLDVSISESKSLCSKSGALEFPKQG